MGILDVFFPKVCISCKKGDSYLCPKCLGGVKRTNLFCPICTRFSKDGFTHASCKRPLGMNRLISVWRYEGVVRKAILKLKYTFASDVVEELVENFTRNLDKNLLFKKACLVPMPMHPKRKKWRGFNQAEEMGKIAAEKLGWYFFPDLLVRTKHTRPQTELKGEERKKNVEGVFSINPNHSLDSKCNTIVVFDDVWTTGSTMKEAVKTLKRKNKKINVIGMVICS